jgi:hypothetical protein
MQQRDLFYSISNQWTARDQRYQATIGFEFELCAKSFTTLRELALGEIDTGASNWTLDPNQGALAAIMARAFVDHGVRVQKVIRGYTKTGPIRQAAEDFYTNNLPLFELRDSLQHAYERIDEEPEPDQLQPLCGDVSWSVLTDIPSLDLYFVAYGPLVGEQVASPAIDMQGFKHSGLNQIWIRAHEHTIDAIQMFANITSFVEGVHEILSTRLDAELAKIGIARGSKDDIRLPSQPTGRLRIEGIQVHAE